MSTLIRPHFPSGSEPSREDDETGVRALLSALPEPDPMPAHLVDRINASLTAEQALRSARMSDAPVAALLPTARRRPSRLLFAVAGAAAAVALFAAVGNNLFTVHERTVASDTAAVAGPAHAGKAESGAQTYADKAPALSGQATTPSLHIAHSGTRYTQAGFATQALALSHLPIGTLRAQDAASSDGPVGTESGLTECLSALGASGAQVVRADVASYAGRPAVVIVATTNGIPLAYVVGRQCSHKQPAVLRPATPLS